MAKRFPFPTAATAALILVAVLLPGSALPDGPGIPGFDKLVHALLFITLAAAAHLDFGLDGPRRVAFALVAALAFSALTEALQIAVDGRSSELADMLADMGGFAVGLAARRPLAGAARKVVLTAGSAGRYSRRRRSSTRRSDR